MRVLPKLQWRGADVTLTLFKDKSHTQLMIEDSLHGGCDQTIAKILEAVCLHIISRALDSLLNCCHVDSAMQM